MMQYLVKHRTQIVFGIAFTMLALWLQLSGQSWSRTIVNRLDYLAYDLRLNLTGVHGASSQKLAKLMRLYLVNQFIMTVMFMIWFAIVL
jgi:hypothetical protein